MAVARVAPRSVTQSLARAAAWLAFTALRARRATLLENLRRTAPNASPAERRRLARRTFGFIADCQLDLYRLVGGAPNEVLSLADIRGLEYVDAARRQGHGVIIVTAHLGNYELGAACLAAMGYPVHGVVEDVEPAILALLEKYRTATGMRTISRNRGARDAYRVLRSGEILLLVADRVIGDVSDGVEVAFCDGRRAIPRGPAQLALAAKAPVVVGLAVRTPDGPRRYRIVLEPPIMPDRTEPDPALTMTRRIADRLSAAIREYPDQWFVFQPGWIASER